MSTELKLRRDVEGDIGAMTPAEGEPIYDITNKRLRVGDGSTAGGLHLSAAADLTPTVTCTVATGETGCVSIVSSTTDVAAGATMAVKVVTTEDLSAQDWWCKVYLALRAVSG